ncbi:hypothetical protein ACS0TY_028792 [Phlomoides rotata]
MDSQNQETRGRGKNKRKWKYDEDAKLIEALLDMINFGAYKANNGFKPGHLNYVEEKLKVSLPNSGLKAKPHIESRIKTLKKDFHIVYDMLNGSNTSGLEWIQLKNVLLQKNLCGTHIFKAIRPIQYGETRIFLFYDDLLIVFGKDRSTGANDDGPADMEEEIQREENNNEEINNVEATMGNGLEDFDDSFSPLQSPRNEAVHKQKKRRNSASSDNLTMMSDIKEAASIIGSEIAAASQVLCKAIGVDAEISEKQQKIDSEIRKITNLSTAEVIKVVHHITKSHELIDVFFSMTEEGREDLVRAILNGDV